jgi:hypothetical protein
MPGQSIFLTNNGKSSTEASAVDKFLKSVGAGFQGSGRLIFALDATASRAKTWEIARELQGDLIREAASIGALSLQLVYFRGGDEIPPECRASEWISDPARLTSIMGRIECRSGRTQIRKVLSHAKAETMTEKVAAIVFIGDACEDTLEPLYSLAKELGELGTPVFTFQEGHGPETERAFRKIAELSHGAYGRFESGAVQQLRDLLRAVAAFAVGGVKALETRQDKASSLLLTQIRKG